MRDDRERLLDILHAIDRILSRISGARAAFDADEMLQIWVLHHLPIIGEAARALTAEFRAENADDVWSKAVGLRNILVHHYFDIDAEQVWKVVERDLPPLRMKVRGLLAH